LRHRHAAEADDLHGAEHLRRPESGGQHDDVDVISSCRGGDPVLVDRDDVIVDEFDVVAFEAAQPAAVVLQHPLGHRRVLRGDLGGEFGVVADLVLDPFDEDLAPRRAGGVGGVWKSGQSGSARTSSSSLSLDCHISMNRYQRAYPGRCRIAHFSPLVTSSW
jgi:hypothetical protein